LKTITTFYFKNINNIKPTFETPHALTQTHVFHANFTKSTLYNINHAIKTQFYKQCHRKKATNNCI